MGSHLGEPCPFPVSEPTSQWRNGVDQLDRVVAVDQRVHIEAERDGGVVEFVDAVHVVEAAGEADLDHGFAEGADARHISSS